MSSDLSLFARCGYTRGVSLGEGPGRIVKGSRASNNSQYLPACAHGSHVKVVEAHPEKAAKESVEESGLIRDAGATQTEVWCKPRLHIDLKLSLKAPVLARHEEVIEQ